MPGNGVSEWLAATIDRRWYSDQLRIDRVFDMLDHDSDGMISRADLQQSLPSAPAVQQKFRSVNRVEFSHLICGEQPSFLKLQDMDAAEQPERFARGVSAAFF